MQAPKIMAILNCTPDSFSDGWMRMGTGDAGGRVPDRAAGGDVAYDWSRRDIPNRASHSDAEDERETRRRQDPFPLLLDRAFQMIAEGADILDIGGESSRPGATPVETDEELRRVIPVIEVIRQQSDIPISIDTTKARVALEAVSAGASMINDISALRADPEMSSVAVETKVPIILMHSRGTPQTMQTMTDYADVVADVMSELKQAIEKAERAGIGRGQISIDPGFGFAKTFEQNVEMLRNLKRFREMGYPLVVGLSRKSFIGKITGEEKPENRLAGSLAAAMHAAQQGVDILRVHDVKETREMLAFARIFN